MSNNEKLLKKIKEKADPVTIPKDFVMDVKEVTFEELCKSEGKLHYDKATDILYKELNGDKFLSYKGNKIDTVNVFTIPEVISLKKEFLNYSDGINNWVTDLNTRLVNVEKFTEMAIKSVNKFDSENKQIVEIKDLLRRLGENQKDIFNTQQELLKRVIRFERDVEERLKNMESKIYIAPEEEIPQEDYQDIKE